MSDLIYQFVNVRRLTTGRRLYALARTREVAGKQGREALVKTIDEAIAHDNETYRQELAWRRSRELPEARGNAADLDTRIDRVLGAVYRHLEDIVIAMADTELGTRARALLNRLFPSGLAPVVQQTFEEQLTNDQAILEALQDDDTAADELGLGAYRDHLAKLVPQFAAELQEHKKPEVSWNELCAMRDQGNVHVRRVTAAILATGGLTTDDEAKRAELLAPVIYQADRSAAARQSRSGTVDIDPRTGDEVPAPGADTDDQ